jgi:heat-inducible transcriptional repressor
MLTERKEAILKYIVEEYITGAEPIGSKFLSEKTPLDVSGATLRNEMRELEELGLLTHPHTSSGRIPTEQGYQYYVEHLMKSSTLSKKEQTILEDARDERVELVPQIKSLAKMVAELCGNAVIVSFGRETIYYTGMSYFFSQPEFRDYSLTVRMSTIFDECEERIPLLYHVFEPGNTGVLIGKNNPFGAACGLVGTRLRKDVLLTLLGPIRMDYQRAVSTLSCVREIIQK